MVQLFCFNVWLSRKKKYLLARQKITVVRKVNKKHCQSREIYKQREVDGNKGLHSQSPFVRDKTRRDWRTLPALARPWHATYVWSHCLGIFGKKAGLSPDREVGGPEHLGCYFYQIILGKIRFPVNGFLKRRPLDGTACSVVGQLRTLLILKQ